ncbi:hypothetical protein GTC6_06002 [Gordonia terrae C-6]|uniref:Uncharacterized protein n=1 Tax=Gordonia terrae C-6 TaxID=1316928 RepID=R7YD42_9ACTN|nr:hypothetical protein [Gordonia terrae]EON33897.1 hypothetical protein GTC6_06002 [Gordonia terrae C-6]
MTLPGPLSGFPPLPSGPLSAGRRDQTDSATSLFGVDPAEVQEIARVWQSAGIAIHAADVEAIGAVIGPSSRVAQALSATAHPARSAVDSIGEHLTVMGRMLRMFDASTSAADVRSGARFRDLEDR